MKLNFKRVSILSLVLLGASAVTAAIIPNKSSDLRVQGSISNAGTDAGAVTCTPTDIVDNAACNASTAAGSATTAAGQANSFEGAAQTVGNTTTR